MLKRQPLPAPAVAYVMGFVPMRPLPNQPPPKCGITARVGQYTRPYVREGHLPPGRVSKGARARYERDHEIKGVLDYAAVINAHRAQR